jgi:hypothetical protein
VISLLTTPGRASSRSSIVTSPHSQRNIPSRILCSKSPLEMSRGITMSTAPPSSPSTDSFAYCRRSYLTNVTHTTSTNTASCKGLMSIRSLSTSVSVSRLLFLSLSLTHPPLVYQRAPGLFAVSDHADYDSRDARKGGQFPLCPAIFLVYLDH